MVLTTAMLFSS